MGQHPTAKKYLAQNVSNAALENIWQKYNRSDLFFKICCCLLNRKKKKKGGKGKAKKSEKKGNQKNDGVP